MPRLDGTHIPADAWAELMKHRAVIDIAACRVVRRSVVGPKTVVVLGAYRGGTSFIGEILTELSIYPGPLDDAKAEPWAYQNYEDNELSPALLAKDWALCQSLISARDAAYEIWAFKHPATVFQLEHFIPLLRNPHFIAIARDPLTAFQGEQSRSANPSVSFPAARHHSALVLDCIARPIGPTLAISYERGKERPGGVREAIKEFLGL